MSSLTSSGHLLLTYPLTATEFLTGVTQIFSCHCKLIEYAYSVTCMYLLCNSTQICFSVANHRIMFEMRNSVSVQ